MKLSKAYNYMTFKLWKINAPDTVQRIVDHPTDELHKHFVHEELCLGFRFLADMINRLFFLIIVSCEVIAFCALIVSTMTSHSTEGRLDIIKRLEMGQ